MMNWSEYTVFVVLLVVVVVVEVVTVVVVLVVVLVEVVVVVVVLVEDFSTPGNINPWVQLGTIGHWRGDWGLAGPATAKALLYLLNSNLSLNY